jgi:putative sterol carrier protein
MAEQARDVFERLKGRGHNPQLEGMRASYRFDIEDAGSWHVAIDDGDTRISEGKMDADCVITSSEEDFLRMIRGEQNPLTAVLQGRINVTGDMALAQKFNGYVRAVSRQPAAARGERE